MHDDDRIEGYHYCMLHETPSLRSELQLIPFLTVGIIGVDSHARDMYGNSNSQVHVYCWKYHPCLN